MDNPILLPLTESELQPIPAPDTVPLTKPHTMVTQSNSLINAYFDMNTVQLRAFLYALGHIHKNDKELGVVKIPIKKLHRTEGGKNYKETIKLAEDLQEVKIKILQRYVNDAGDVKRHYESYIIFPTVKHTEDSKYIVTRINPDLKQFLLNLQGNYTQAELEKLLSLKTIQAYRIYMFIKMNMYDIDNNPDALRFDYKELRLMLGLDVIDNSDQPKKTKIKTSETDLFNDVSNKVEIVPAKPRIKTLKYADFDNFKKRILKTAQTELRKSGLLDFDFEADKAGGRSIKDVVFKLRSQIGIDQPKKKEKPDLFNQQAPTSTLSPEQQKLRENAMRIMKDNYQFTDQQVAHYISKLKSIYITKANKWFQENQKTLTYTSKTDWFSARLDNLIKKS
jgi:plasmid replication initiation protein